MIKVRIQGTDGKEHTTTAFVTLEYYHGSAQTLGEVHTGMGTAVVSYSGKIGSESLGGR